MQKYAEQNTNKYRSIYIYIYGVKKRTCKSAVFLQKYIFVKKRHLDP